MGKVALIRFMKSLEAGLRVHRSGTFRIVRMPQSTWASCSVLPVDFLSGTGRI
jgi:hypothetical protein